MNAEDPLFILYTSGSTGKPKGVLHTTAGYLLWSAYTARIVFDLRDDDVFWCTADVGWVTGHSYIVYGPLANGATEVMFEGVPNHPDPSRFWQAIDKHGVNIFYTAPTAIRALMREGDAPVKRAPVAAPARQRRRTDQPGSLALVFRNRGDGQRCPIVDTWWQTETGGILISPRPGATALKPGSATRPPRRAPGAGRCRRRAARGRPKATWCCSIPGPGRCARCTATTNASSTPTSHLSRHKYFTGDGCRRDADGDY